MQINPNRTIAEIQEEFHSIFPGLKLAFYKKGHLDHEGSPRKLTYEASLVLAQISPELQAGDVDLRPTKTVADLEAEMESRFGLHVQIFRRSNDLWLQTSVTDDWTLEVQNRKGLHSIQA
jgi:hypothetical protein